MTTQERLLKFIDHLGMQPAQFEKSAGISNGYVNNIKKSVGEAVLAKITDRYPQLNKVWLIFGDGKMILDNSYQANEMHDDGPGYPQKELSSGSLSSSIIQELVRSCVVNSEANKITAEANKITAEANKIASENNRDVIVLVRSVSSNAPSGTQPNIYVAAEPVLQKLAQAGTPSLWKSKEQGLKLLGKLLHDSISQKQE